MENEKKNSRMLVGILVGLVIALLIGVGLFATGTISFKETATNDNGQTSENSQTNNNENVRKNDTIVGEYFHISNDEIKSESLLDLMEDGTFYYFTGATCGNLGSGNYEVQNNKLTLYFKFRQSCAGELYMAKNDFYTEDINIHSTHLDLRLEYIINDDKTLSPLTATSTKIQKTSDSYDNLYKYYNQTLIMSYATLKKSNEQ